MTTPPSVTLSSGSETWFVAMILSPAGPYMVLRKCSMSRNRNGSDGIAITSSASISSEGFTQGIPDAIVRPLNNFYNPDARFFQAERHGYNLCTLTPTEGIAAQCA